MQWVEMTSPDVAKAAKEIGLTIIPVGATERHGDHLPVGVDGLTVDALCRRAAEEEPVVLFPPVFTGMNTEQLHAPGSISVRPELIMQYLEEICDEIGRNGFPRIMIVDGHGGNRYMLPQIVMNTLDEEKPYVLYYFPGHGSDQEVRKRVLEAKTDAHAGESETSGALHLFPELVQMDRAPKDPIRSQKPDYLQGIYSNVDWFASYPENVGGEPAIATAEKGKALFENQVARLVDAIRRVKQDDRSPELLKEFYRRVKEVSS